MPHTFAWPCCVVVLFSMWAGASTAAEMRTVDAESVVKYVESCRKPNGAFGPKDQEYTDAAWNYPAVMTLRTMGKEVEQSQAVLQHGLGFPEGHGGYGHWLFFHRQMIKSLLGVKDDLSSIQFTLIFQGFKPNYYGSPFGGDAELMFKLNAEDLEKREQKTTQLGYYNLSSLYYTLVSLRLYKGQISNSAELIQFIQQRQAPCGGFVDVRVANHQPLDEEAHVVQTWFAVAALGLLGAEVQRPQDCAKFVHECQIDSGAYRWHPTINGQGNEADVYYTWAALNVLANLQKAPQKQKQMLSWLNSLQNYDGGFGDKPGWRSRLYSTYYAVRALQLLTGEATAGIQTKHVEVPVPVTIADGEFQIYQGLNKMPVCTPDDLGELRQRGFNLLALKSADFQQAAPLLAAIEQKQLPMDVVMCPEAYPHAAWQKGGLLLNHIGNITLDPRWNEQQKAIWAAADEAGKKKLSWVEYETQVIQPLRKLGCLVYPEHEFEMELGYSAYDAGVSGTGYNAVLAGFNWAPRDFVRVFPWRERYTDKLTPVADADAHGDLQKWSPQLDHTRHLYLAKGPTYADFLDAAAHGRVVCVIYAPEGVASGVSYYGPAAAVEYVKKRQAAWQWWK